MRRVFDWIRDAFGGARLTRPPIPGPNDLHSYMHKLSAVASGAGEKLVKLQLATGAQQVAEGTFDARSQRRTRSPRKRLARLAKRIAPYGPGLSVPDGFTVFDPLVSRVLFYLLTFGLAVGILETVGTYSSLVVFDGTLGQFRILLSVASGVILALCGHACGHSFFTAVKAEGLVKRLLFGLASALVAVAIIAVSWTGLDRSANEESRALGKQAAVLIAEGGRLESVAKGLEGPQLQFDKAEKPTKASLKRAAQLRRDAAQLRGKAARAEAKSGSVRSLNFLAGIQCLGLAVGIVGGWLFAEAAPLREGRLRGRAAALRARIESIVLDERGAAGEAYGHWLAMMATEGVDLVEYGLPKFDVARHIVPELQLTVSNGDGHTVVTSGGGQ